MPRPLRIEYSGAIYHIMNRGDRRQQIFRDLHDRVRFLNTLTEACGKTEWQIHAYCLMSNHFHLVIETPQPNLVAGMKWLLGVYTKRFNIRHKTCGHLFAGQVSVLVFCTHLTVFALFEEAQLHAATASHRIFRSYLSHHESG